MLWTAGAVTWLRWRNPSSRPGDGGSRLTGQTPPWLSPAGTCVAQAAGGVLEAARPSAAGRTRNGHGPGIGPDLAELAGVDDLLREIDARAKELERRIAAILAGQTDCNESENEERCRTLLSW